MTELVYPQGCKPIGEDLGPDELIRRLKVSEFLLLFISKLQFNLCFIWYRHRI